MESKPKKISIIVPAYNKAKVLFSTLSSLLSELKSTAYDFEIILVDDGSSDSTINEALRCKTFNGNTKKIKVFHYAKNYGKGFALRHGFYQSTGDLIAFFDADSDLPAVNLRTLLAYMDQEKAEIVVGSKRHKLSKVDYPIARRIMSRTYQILIRFLFNLNLTDTQVGVKVFKRQVLEDVIPRLKVYSNLEIFVLANTYGFKKIVESPIISNHQFEKLPNFKLFKAIFFDTLEIFTNKVFKKTYEKPVWAFHLIKI